MGSEHYCLRWNNHQSNLLGVFSQLLQDESLVDVTLACAEGHSIRAHKVVLSACSSYFQTLFVDHPNRHPIVILKDVRFAELQTLIEFMYKGEVNVEYCQLSALLKTAESLKVKGLAEMTNLNSTRDDRGESSHKSSSNMADKPSTPENAVKRPPNDDMDTSSGRRSLSPPPTLLRSSRTRHNSTCEDNDSCDDRGGTPDLDHLNHRGPNDMTMGNNNSNSCNPPLANATATVSAATSRLSSPHSSEPIPGPSGMLPVQQVPLSLKKEVDWDRSMGDDKSITGESSSDYRHPLEPDAMLIEGRYGPSCAVAASSRHGPDLQISNPSSRSSTPFQFPFPSFSGAFSPGLSHDMSAAEGSGRPNCSILSLLQQQGLIASSIAEDASMFRCSICMAAFPSAWLLEQHTSLQHTSPQSDGEGPEDKPFKCDQCGQSYRYRSAYLKHREQNHRARLPADKLFTCDVCGMQFRYLKSFKKHRLNHALEKLHSRSPSELDILARAAKQDVGFRGSLPESSTDYGNRMLAMMMHRGRFNGEMPTLSGRVTAPPTVVTDVGSDQVSSSNEAIVGPPAASSAAFERAASAPVSRVEQQNFYKFSMDDYYCNSNYLDGKKPGKSEGEQDETIDSLALALSMASNGGSDAFRSAQEVSLLNLLRMDAVERQRERRFSCPFCGKCVRSKENLKLHIRKHTGERPFACFFCSRAFGGKSDLTRHLRIHTGERPYHCQMCGKCFARADYLSKHLTTHIHNSQR